jgi:hypothetical protein
VAYFIRFINKGINGAFLSPPTPEVPGFESSGGKKMAGLQVSSSTCHHLS